MKARDFREHCIQIAQWVDWKHTVDQFMYGDPEIEVRGIAVTWLATNDLLKIASKMGHNLVISHEGAFYTKYEGTESGERHHKEKQGLIDRLGITLMRCHDTWDRMPKVGIPDAWADFLGFPSEPRKTESYYKICKVGGARGIKVVDLAKAVLEKTRPLGQAWVGMMGDPNKKVMRMAVGTGAITRLALMYDLEPDVILATDDGLSTTADGLWSIDLDVPVLVVNHATAELPGMMALAEYIKKRFASIPVDYLLCGFPFQAVT